MRMVRKKIREVSLSDTVTLKCKHTVLFVSIDLNIRLSPLGKVSLRGKI